MVRSLGADTVIDYTQEDFTQSDQKYDVIFDTAGKLAPAQGKKTLKEYGIYLNVHTASNGLKLETEDWNFFKELVEAGKLRSIIDRCYPLEQTAEGHDGL